MARRRRPRATAAAVAREASARGAAGEAAFAAYWLGVLEISLGNYGSAVACLNPAYSDDTPFAGTQALPDLVGGGRPRGSSRTGRTRVPADGRSARPRPTGPCPRLLARSRALLALAGRGRGGSTRTRSPRSTEPGPLRKWPRPSPLRQWLRRQRRRRRAGAQLRAALDVFERIGPAGFAQRARRSSGPPASRPQAGSRVAQELPAQEAPHRRARRAAVRAKSGRSPRGCSSAESTVDYRLRKVFRKLASPPAPSSARLASWTTTSTSTDERFRRRSPACVRDEGR